MRVRALNILMCSVIISVFGRVLPLEAQERGKVIRLERDGLKLEMQALGHDAVQAFFIGRGFSAQNARMIAHEGCFFRSAIGNGQKTAGDKEITIDLRRWRLTGKGGRGGLRVREDWQKIWVERGVAEDARTAFYWALFPTRQSYGPTDYNWGMLSFGLTPGTEFDLKLRWRFGAKEQLVTLKGLQCAR